MGRGMGYTNPDLGLSVVTSSRVGGRPGVTSAGVQEAVDIEEG